MKLEKKFYLDPEDGIDVAKECVDASEGEGAILNVTKNSVLGESVRTFKELKKYAAEAEKELLIESVDDHILELASLAGIRAVNPVFRAKERAVSDIYPVARAPRENARRKSTPDADEEKDAGNETAPETIREKPDVSIIFEHKARAEERKRKKETPLPAKNFFEEEPEDGGRKERKPRKKMKGKTKALVTFTPVAVILAAVWIAVSVLPRADVALALKKEIVQFDETLEVSVKATLPDIASSAKTIVPGELLSAKKNMFIPFDADKTEQVSRKAKGTLVVSNAFSSSPQTLVATTRFEAPNGIIFRLDEKTTIPGAKISGKNVTPGSIEVKVTADQPGEESNISPTKGWKIPGFKGTDRYDKFIVENTKPMSGGFVGEAPVVSEERMKKTADEAETSLNNALSGEMVVLMADTFRLLDGAEAFRITKNEFQTMKEDPNKTGMFVEGELKRIVFREQELKDALFGKYGSKFVEQGYTKAAAFEISYGTTTASFDEGKMNVPISGSITYVHDIDSETLAERFSGKNESELRQDIFSIPGIDNATISLWPFWVDEVPSSRGKIFLEIK